MYNLVKNVVVPASGTAVQASRGFMVERDSKETSEESCPGKWTPAAWTRYPVVASIAIRECLSSEARNQANVDSDPNVARFKGSNPLNGAVAPGMPSRPMRSAVEDPYRRKRDCQYSNH